MMDSADLTAVLDRLFQEGQRVLADFAALAEQPAAGGAATEATLERLREQSRRHFDDMKRQWQDQSQPWIAMLRAWAQLADGTTPAELLMAPMAWWRPVDRDTASAAADASQQHRVEAAAAELVDARDAYLALLQQVAEDAIERFAASLRTLDSEQQTLRLLYQYWLTAAESAYEEVLASEEFAETTGRLTNAWSELLLILQEDLDRMLRSTGLPTRRELTETQAQLHELRREQRQRERELRADLDALRARLDAAGLQPQPAAPASRARPRKRAPNDA